MSIPEFTRARQKMISSVDATYCFSTHLYRGCPQDLFPLCTCRQVPFRNLRRNYSHTFTCTHTLTHTQTHIFIYRNEMKSTQPHRNLIGRSMTAPPPVLSPRSILPQTSSHCAFIFSNKYLTRSKFVLNFCYFKNCVLHIVSRGFSVILQQTANNLVDWGFFVFPVACRCNYYILKFKIPATNAVTRGSVHCRISVTCRHSPIHDVSSSDMYGVWCADCMAGSATAEYPKDMPTAMFATLAASPTAICCNV